MEKETKDKEVKDKEQSNKALIKVGITIGDINGIGPEIIVKALHDSRILTDIIPVVYGSNNSFRTTKNNSIYTSSVTLLAKVLLKSTPKKSTSSMFGKTK